MSAFKDWGITHLSASSINMARTNPALWIVEKLHGVRGTGSPAMFAGAAVERGIEKWLVDESISKKDAIEIARKEYIQRVRFHGFDPALSAAKEDEMCGRRAEGRLSGFPGMVSVGCEALKDFREESPPVCQRKISLDIEGIPVPIIGFLDFCFESRGVDIDLKTTARLPSSMSFAHQVQAAIYQRARNQEQRFLYLTKNDTVSYSLENDQYRRAWDSIMATARWMEAILSGGHDLERVSRRVLPNYDLFQWDQATRRKGLEIWGY
jgi:hypothetical protein